MTDSHTNNFRLKDGKVITINGHDVERIRILNDIVWEKARETTLTLTSSLMNPVVKQSFILTAYLIDTNHSNEIINGNIHIVGEGVDTTIKTVNGIAKINITPQRIGQYTYTATFEKTGRYLPSTHTITINVKKDTPKIEIVGLENNKNSLYYEWKIGCKLTDINGALIKSYPVCIIINGRKYPRKTNDKGIAVLNIRLGQIGQYTATFKSHSNDIYNESILDYTYNYQKYNNIKIPYLSYLDKGDKNNNWTQINTNQYQCGVVGAPCNSNNGIKKNNIPNTLQITFNKNDINTSVYQAKLTFDSYSLANKCYTPDMGGWFKQTPQIKFSSNGSTFELGNNIIAFPSQSDIYGYSSHAKLSQSITWENVRSDNYNIAFPLTSNPIITFNYPANEGVQEGAIQLNNIALTLSIIPSQSFNFGDIIINSDDNDCNNNVTVTGITDIYISNNDINFTKISQTITDTVTVIKDMYLVDGIIYIKTVDISKDGNADNIVTNIEIKNNNIVYSKN